jgi:hypothetical protein
VGEEVVMKAVDKPDRRGRGEEALIVDEAHTGEAALKRDDPAPPTVAGEVIGRSGAAGLAGAGVGEVTGSEAVAIEVPDVLEACPDGIRGVFFEWLEGTELPGEECRAAAGVDSPSGADRPLGSAGIDRDGFSRFHPEDLCRTEKNGSFLTGDAEHVFIENLPVDLISRHPGLEVTSQFAAASELGIVFGVEPEPESLFGEVVVVEVGGEGEALREKAAADLGRGFSDFAVEGAGTFDDGDAEGGPFPPEESRGRGT